MFRAFAVQTRLNNEETKEPSFPDFSSSLRSLLLGLVRARSLGPRRAFGLAKLLSSLPKRFECCSN
jgi:hypothetical protein